MLRTRIRFGRLPALTGLSIAVLVASCGAMAQEKAENSMAAEVTAAESKEKKSHQMFDFAEADLDGNGVLDATEIRAWMEASIEERVERMIKQLDTDGDAALSQAELIEAAVQRGKRSKRWGKHRRGGFRGHDRDGKSSGKDHAGESEHRN